MKIYGFDEVDVLRGELRAMNMDATYFHFEGEAESVLGWEYGSRKFAEAQVKLISRMQEEGVDEEMIEVVRSMKAKFVPVDEYDG